MPSSSSLWLMTAYVVIALALQAIAVVIGAVLDRAIPAWSMIAFMCVYFTMFWLAWPIALRITEPRSAPAEA
jgi:hypothetical protein